jgi:hypothetical protein
VAEGVGAQRRVGDVAGEEERAGGQNGQQAGGAAALAVSNGRLKVATCGVSALPANKASAATHRVGSVQDGNQLEDDNPPAWRARNQHTKARNIS